MSAPEWEAPSELYFYDEWLQQNAKGRILCGNNRYIRADLCTPTDERVRALEAENARLRKSLSIYADVVSAYASDCELTSDPAYDWLQDDGGNVARAALRDMGADT